MKNKKSIMCFSGLQILIFHLWVYVLQRNQAEIFLKQTAYIGVDIFFFVSAYSLAGREVKNYLKFIWSRFQAVYLKFILFALIAFFYAKWTVKYLLEVISGVNLFQKGGGAFLWFLPAIMIFYLLFPLFQKCDKKNRILTMIFVVLLWAGVSFLATGQKKLHPMFIYWHRIPVFLLGYYAAKLKAVDEIWKRKWLQLVLGVVFTTGGFALLNLFAFKVRLQVPFKDMFYVTVIPAAVGLILLVGLIPELKPIRWIGSSTLEMYAIQMIFGYNIENKLLKATKYKQLLLTNLLTIIFVVVTAVLVHFFYDYAQKSIKKVISKKDK